MDCLNAVVTLTDLNVDQTLNVILPFHLITAALLCNNINFKMSLNHWDRTTKEK